MFFIQHNCKYLFPINTIIMPPIASSSRHNNNTSCFNKIVLLVFLIVTCYSEFNYGQQSSSSSRLGESNVYSSVNLGTLVQKLILLQNEKQQSQLFVGGRNLLLRVDPLTLNVNENLTTGPILDNYNCPPSPVKCSDSVRTMTPSDCINLFPFKVAQTTLVMACYSTNQGMCYISPQGGLKAAKLLGDPSNAKNYVASRSSSVVVSMLDTFSSSTPSTIFIAHSYDDRPLPLSPPTISKKKLSAPVNLAYWSEGTASLSARDVRALYKNSKWPINYIYGFKHEDYVFFVKTEPESLSGTQRVTKIIRICIGDSFFGSYSEIQVKCNDQTVVTSATLGKMDDYLRNTFDTIRPLVTSNVLFLAFENTKLNKPVSHTHSESRICAFAMDHLMYEFETARNACYARRSGKLIETFAEPSSRCIESEHQQCQQSANMFIEVTKVVDGYLLYGDKPRITSMVSLLQGPSNHLKYTLFIGTENGLVKKIASGRDIFTIELSKSRIQPDPVVDSNEENIFMATGQSLIKLPVKTCSYYYDCGSCIESQSKDTIDCAWTGKACVVNSDKVVKVAHCEPKIISFSPRKGPTQGGTIVKVKGVDLGFHDETANTENSITVGGKSCSIITWNYTDIECKIVTLPEQLTPSAGRIVLSVTDISARKGYDIKGVARSDDNYQFVVASVTSVKPLISPLTGGVNVFLRGTHLDSGSNLEILLAGVQCESIQIIDSNAIECISGSAEKQGKTTQGPIGVNIDSASISTNLTFSYFIDPTFTYISPNVTSATSAVNITVIGDHFDSLYQPRLIVSAIVPKAAISPLILASDCTLINVTSFTCPSPIMPSNVYFESPITATVAFANGGSTKHLPTEFILVYLPDPKFSDKIVATTGLGGSRTLEIMGQHLHTGYGMKVMLVNQQDGATLECKDLRSIDGSLIACNIPLEDYPGDPTISLWNISVITGTKQLAVGAVSIEPDLESESQSSTIAGVIVGMVAALVVITLIMMYLLKRNGYLLRSEKGPPSLGVAYRSPENGFQRQGSQNEYHPTGSRISGQPLLFNRSSDEIKFVIEPEKQSELQADGTLFSRDYLTREKVIGQGNFGLVYQGYLKLPNKQDEKIKVAIKTLKTERGILSQEKGEAFLAEGLIMKEFTHENVLSLVGVSIDFDGSPMIITPFMEHGDLRSYIQHEDLEFTVIQLIQFGVQVAQGMVYLAGLKFVHRDLAARNCMVDEFGTVKVADFGLSRDVYTTSYYSDADNFRKPLPRKWMALESLERGNYDTKSDVWSYGVLLWELLTRGDIPYSDVEDWKMKDYLKAGFRLPRPEHCPPEVYSVMKECWVEDPKSRPTFVEILKLIEVAIESNEKKYLEQKTDRNIRYINDPSIFSNPEYDGTMVINS